MSTAVTYSTAVPLAKKYRHRINANIKEAALKWGITLQEGVKYSVYAYQGGETKHLGNHPIAKQTSMLYEGQLQQIWRYCGIRGKYWSMLMLDWQAPQAMYQPESEQRSHECAVCPLSTLHSFPPFQLLILIEEKKIQQKAMYIWKRRGPSLVLTVPLLVT